MNAKKKLLVFCRFYLVPDFRKNVEAIVDEFDVSFLTDGHSPGTEDTRKPFYTALHARKRCDELSSEIESEVIARCRLLRNINSNKAKDVVHAMALTLASSLDRIKPMAILSQMVDDYVTHLLFILAARRSIKVVGYFSAYFPGLVQLTDNSDGRAFAIREPSDEDVQAVMLKIGNNLFRQNYNQNDSYSLGWHAYRVMRYAVKRILFMGKAIIQRDPYNSHYMQTPFIAERRRMSDYPRRNYFHDDWRKELDKLRANRSGPVYYFPLGYFPEASIDYWVEDRSIIDYEKKVIDILVVLSKSGLVLVKEHLHMMGARRPKFYQSIKAIAGVVSVYPLEYSNEVLEHSDAVVIGGGSIGIEATLRGKPIFTFCHAAYWSRPSRSILLNISEVQFWPEKIREGLHRFMPMTEKEKLDFIRDCLRTTVRQRDGKSSWPLIESADLRELLKKAHSSPKCNGVDDSGPIRLKVK